ncbi:MAG: histidinol-phosphate transaminase [Spirulinaceae cyanobacterium]
MFPFIRPDLNQLQAYKAHPGGKVNIPIDQLDTNESPFDLPLELKDKLASVYQQAIKTNRYPDGSHLILKQKIAAYVNESAGLERAISPENISVGNGSDELIRSILIATCLGGEGAILVANPTFSMYGILAKTLGIPVVSIERKEDDFALNINQAKEAIKATKNPPIRVVFVVHPNSPTANPLTPEEITWLRNLPQNILVVIDEAYFEFSQTSLVEELKSHPNWIILRTFSKAFRLAAHRIGYGIAHPEMIIALEKVRLPYNLPSFSQAAAQIALDFRHLLLASIPKTLQERQRLYQAFCQNPALEVWPSSANFLYLRSQTNLQQLTQTLKQKGTLIRHTGGGLRVTVGSSQENERTIARFNLNPLG